jgi:hypothetical protein
VQNGLLNTVFQHVAFQAFETELNSLLGATCCKFAEYCQRPIKIGNGEVEGLMNSIEDFSLFALGSIRSRCFCL